MQKKSDNHFQILRDKWINKHKNIQKRILKKHRAASKWVLKNSKNIAVSSVTGLLMLAHPANASIISDNIKPEPPKEANTYRNVNEFIKILKDALPEKVQPLTKEEEVAVSHILSTYFQIPVSAYLENISLNRSYGLIGAEQHLMRYPGDNMSTHFQSKDEEKFTSSGMAPGRGAWGYFATSKNELSEEDINREKYYIAVQTFLSPGWNENPNKMYKFFKYKKMMVVNPDNGKAVVAAIGDAGPAPYTGKHLGGSPEVMSHLERQDGAAKGPVLYFFINDKENKIPLGPVNSATYI
jgi:hypothetical protein